MAIPGTAKPQPLSVSRPDDGVEELVESVFVEDLAVAAAHPALNENLAAATCPQLRSKQWRAITRSSNVVKC
jgi:hypothetical protein